MVQFDNGRGVGGLGRLLGAVTPGSSPIRPEFITEFWYAEPAENRQVQRQYSDLSGTTAIERFSAIGDGYFQTRRAQANAKR